MNESTKSHSLIDDQLYKVQYKRIKQERGAQLVEEWTERTDPKRYVYEDCGILAYILCVKQALNLEFQYFADLACGNGLLTYLLNAEGIRGCGIDARSRGIWDKFREDGAELHKTSINPSDTSCTAIPERTDFLIGNHSDELTPWIPVMAARRNCSFFLLPCCSFDFFHKFNNKPTNKNKGGIGRSKYNQYLDYVLSIGTRLGFEMRVDRLKTCSAKRICFVGTIPADGLMANKEQIIEQLLSESTRLPRIEFKPIGDTVDPKNCTRIPFEFRLQLALKLSKIMIEQTDERIGDWRCGGKIHLTDLSKHLTDEEKSHMKSQFGGLQTFLKNHSQAFRIEKGMARLRRWPEEYLDFCKIPEKFKRSYCWFFSQHPQGCPVDESICPFIHEQMKDPTRKAQQTSQKIALTSD